MLENGARPELKVETQKKTINYQFAGSLFTFCAWMHGENSQKKAGARGEKRVFFHRKPGL